MWASSCLLSVVAIAIAAAVMAQSSEPAPQPTGPPALRYALEAGAPARVTLDGSAPPRRFYPAVSPLDGGRLAALSVDGQPQALGQGPLTTDGMTVGEHTMQATVVGAGGHERAVSARFRVASHIVARADFEDGSPGWERQCLRRRMSVGSRAPAPLQGSGRARFEVREGDVEPSTGSERCELTGFPFRPPAEYWIRYAISVPARTQLQDRAWMTVFQYKESSDEGPPPMAMFLDYAGGPGQFRLASGDSSAAVWRGPRIARGRWYDFTTHVRFSADPNRGYVELWVNGARQRLTNGRRREYIATARRGAQSYLKAGIYRDPRYNDTTVLYYDSIIVGNSYAAVHRAGGG